MFQVGFDETAAIWVYRRVSAEPTWGKSGPSDIYWLVRLTFSTGCYRRVFESGEKKRRFGAEDTDMATDSNRITGSPARRSVLILAPEGPGSPENAVAWRLRQILETLLEEGLVSVDLVLGTSAMRADGDKLLDACRSVVFHPPGLSAQSIWERFRTGASRVWAAVHSPKPRATSEDRSYCAVLGLGFAVLPQIRQCPAPDAVRVLDLTDLGPFYPDTESAGFVSGKYLGGRGRKTLLRHLRGVDFVTVPCERDVALWRSLGMGERVAVVPYRSSLAASPSDEEAFDRRRPRILIPAENRAGGFDGVRFLRRRIVPRVRTWVPKARFLVSGGGSRIEPGEGFEIAAGSFRDLLPTADVVVIPARAGKRVRPTVIETLGAGKPMVATRAAIYGLDLEEGVDAQVVEEPWQLADALIAVLTEAPVRATLQTAAAAHARSTFNPEAMKDALERVLGLVPESRRIVRRGRDVAPLETGATKG